MYKYLIIIEKANGNYSAYSPDLPGCVATRKIVEETKKNMQEAIEFHIEGLTIEGLLIPESEAISDYVTIG